MNKPIIIAGMHRSGTSLLARILDDLGIFMGKKISGNHEAKFFQELNIWLFNELGGRWDSPPDMHFLLENKDMLELTTTILERSVHSLAFMRYLGWKNYFFKNRFLRIKKNLWGWKDPRNVYTLPVWLKLFPEAKVIYIERHGVDVANSLKHRSLREMESRRKHIDNPKLFTRIDSGVSGLSSESIRCCTLEGGFSLWEEYMREGRKNISRLDSQNLLMLRYEELLEEPDINISKIKKFLGMEEDNPEQNISINLKTGRAYAYKDKPELQEFAHLVSHRLMNYKA